MKKSFTVAGFTLAEVLITLGIIGVVAAMTIPTLMHKQQEIATISALKKVYSTLSSAATRIIAENGGIAKNICVTSDNRCIRDVFLNFMTYTKKCSLGSEPSTWGNCFVKPIDRGGTWEHLSGGAIGIGEDASTILVDGTFVHFYQYSGDCTINGFGVINVCTRILVDLNGFKNPNITGKDIFYFVLTDTGIKPVGDGKHCDGNGENCAAYYLLK